MKRIRLSKKMIVVINIIVFLTLIFTGGCRNENEYRKIKKEIEMDQISFENLNTLKSVRILFGHQSVGNDILEGIKTFFESHQDSPSLVIKEISPGDGIDSPGLYEAKIGKNRFPDTKIDDFKKMVLENGNSLDIAFMKFCFIDIDESTEIERLFRSYVQMIDQIKESFPKIRIIHFTVPLQSHVNGKKEWLMSFLKPDLKNMYKWKFNQLLREKYRNNELVFDLARIESTCKDGSRKVLTQNGISFEVLNEEYTNDGGHLNKIGQEVVAKDLLHFLDSIYSKR